MQTSWKAPVFLMREILDQWTVGQAWEHTYGSLTPPRPEDIKDEHLCELDAVLASYFDDETRQGRRKGAAALRYLMPRIVDSKLPPGPASNRKEYLAKSVSKCVADYFDESLLFGEPYDGYVEAIRQWNLYALPAEAWLVVWAALGESGLNVKDTLHYDFYIFAGSYFRFFLLR